MWAGKYVAQTDANLNNQCSRERQLKETAKKLTSSKGILTKKLIPASKMDSLGSIEEDYIKNLQKQVSLLEFETSYLKERARKVTRIQPKFTRGAEKILQKMKELEATINGAQAETAMKENSIKILEAETQAMHRHLQSLSDKNASEKLILMEDATVLKKLANSYTQAVSHKKGELLKIQQEVQRIIHSVKEKEHEVHHLEMQLQQQFQQCQETERKLTESRSECIQLQALIHQLEETFLTGPPSTQQHVAKELREDIEKLRQVLREKELSADEDKYLCNKMAEDCGHLTKENGLLQAQVLEATRQLNKERQLREEESTSHSRSVSELARERERERQLEMELTYLKTLLQDERQRVLKVQEQMLCLHQESKSVNQHEQLLQSQLTDLEERVTKIQMENSKLQTKKTFLVEHISYLHKQLAEKEKEINFVHSHVNSLSCDLNNLKTQVDLAMLLQKEK